MNNFELILPVGVFRPLEKLVKFDPSVSLVEIENEYILQALIQSNNIKRTARLLGINRNTLKKKISEMKIEVKTKRGRPQKESI